MVSDSAASLFNICYHYLDFVNDSRAYFYLVTEQGCMPIDKEVKNKEIQACMQIIHQAVVRVGVCRDTLN